MSHGDRSRLFELYRKTFPRLQAMKRKANSRGLYFERMMMYGRGPCDGNQLEWILSQYKSRKGVRRSMFQATTFDPRRDHVRDAQLGFPCLQQVSFVPTEAGLVTNAFYATQQIFDKAYGNYLGLAQLGAFMAHEMGIRLARLNVMVGVAKLERISKRELESTSLVKAARTLESQAIAPSAARVYRRCDRGSNALSARSPKDPKKRPRGRPRNTHSSAPRPSHQIELDVAVQPGTLSTPLAPTVLRHLVPAKNI